jgi:hypothetical protein
MGIVLVVMTAVALSIAGVVAGVLGILFGLAAYRRSATVMRECNAPAQDQGSAGSRGTADPSALRDVAIVRYDALNEMTGQFSFSLAVLNAHGDGIVLSSINGRTETRTYAKAVVAGKPAQDLSPEEEQAVRSARLGQGLSVAAAPAIKKSAATA